MSKKMTETSKQIHDLANRTARTTIALIDAISGRGGFKGEELLTIGQLREQCGQLVQIIETVQSETAEEDKK